MQNKLITLAVSSALAAIGAAPVLAQNATVNVYGTLYGEISSINNGNKKKIRYRRLCMESSIYGIDVTASRARGKVP